LERRRGGSGGAGGLSLEQLRHGGGGNRMGGVVPRVQDGVTLRRSENVEPPDRLVGIARRRLEQANQTAGQSLHAGAVKQVGPIVEPQLQLLSWAHRKAQWVVWGIVALDAGEVQTVGGCGETAAIERIGLEPHQGVKQLAQSA